MKAVFSFSIEIESMREMAETKEEYSGPNDLSIAMQDRSSSRFKGITLRPQSLDVFHGLFNSSSD